MENTGNQYKVKFFTTAMREIENLINSEMSII